MKLKTGDFVIPTKDGFITKARKNSRYILGVVIEEGTLRSGIIVKMKTKDEVEYWVAISGYYPEFVMVKP